MALVAAGCDGCRAHVAGLHPRQRKLVHGSADPLAGMVRMDRIEPDLANQCFLIQPKRDKPCDLTGHLGNEKLPGRPMCQERSQQFRLGLILARLHQLVERFAKHFAERGRNRRKGRCPDFLEDRQIMISCPAHFWDIHSDRLHLSARRADHRRMKAIRCILWFVFFQVSFFLSDKLTKCTM